MKPYDLKVFQFCLIFISKLLNLNLVINIRSLMKIKKLLSILILYQTLHKKVVFFLN